jgi:DNA-directed RNA polymerase subunit omega
MKSLPSGEFLFQMIEELKDEELIRKIGGRFRLSALIQKRLVALNEGTASAIDYGRSSSTATRDRLNTTIQEILQDKIYLSSESGKRVPHDEGISIVLDSEFTEGF